jgi:hypothetical protein
METRRRCRCTFSVKRLRQDTDHTV